MEIAVSIARADLHSWISKNIFRRHGFARICSYSSNDGIKKKNNTQNCLCFRLRLHESLRDGKCAGCLHELQREGEYNRFINSNIVIKSRQECCKRVPLSFLS